MHIQPLISTSEGCVKSLYQRNWPGQTCLSAACTERQINLKSFYCNEDKSDVNVKLERKIGISEQPMRMFNPKHRMIANNLRRRKPWVERKIADQSSKSIQTDRKPIHVVDDQMTNHYIVGYTV